MKKLVAKVTNYQLQTLRMHQIDTAKVKTFDQAQKIIKKIHDKEKKSAGYRSKHPSNLEGGSFFKRWNEE